jgi:hypothetical protein
VRRWNHRLLAAPNQTPNCSRISFVIHRDLIEIAPFSRFDLHA